MKDLLRYSPTRLAELIRTLKVSPVEVVDSYINRIKETNPTLNAVVVRTFNQARDRAHEIKEEITDLDDPPPLLGVPCTIKEMISVRNQPITCGSTYREDARSTRDATVVRSLREAGAIPLGLTNVPEFGLWIESNNPVYGRTNNPHKTERTSGGSSGGEAAMVAAGGTSFGLGSDMGGSIRIPSLFCGVYGHKSVADHVDSTGHFPVEHSPDRLEGASAELVSVGPMTRHASDLTFLFELIQGDPTNRPDPSVERSGLDVEDLKIYTLESPNIQLTRSTSDAQQRAVKRVADLLAAEGATIRSLPEDYFRETTSIYLSHLESLDMPSMEHLAGSGDSINVFSEIARNLTFSNRHTFPLLMLCLTDKVYSPSKSSLEKSRQKRRELRQDLIEKLSPNGVLVMPPYPTAAPKHGHTLRRPFDLMYSAVFNTLDLPVTSVPYGRNDDGLPTGVQLVVPPGQDRRSLRLAEFLDRTSQTPSIPTVPS